MWLVNQSQYNTLLIGYLFKVSLKKHIWWSAFRYFVIKKPFKNAVKQFEKHLDENLDDYVVGKLTSSWEMISQSKDMIIRSFRKCVIRKKVEGSEDTLIVVD